MTNNYSDKFNNAIKFVLSNEGGYSNNPHDVGMATNFGISLRFYKDKINPSATIEDIKNITLKEAIDIYHEFFWDNPRFGSKLESIINSDVATRLLDTIINIGEFRGIQVIQRALWACIGNNTKLKDDGILGTQTVSSINYFGQALLPAFKATRAGYYRELVAHNSNFQEFLNGWLNRAYQ